MVFLKVGTPEFIQRQRENWKNELDRIPDLIDYLRYQRRGGATRHTLLSSCAAMHRSFAGYEYYLERHVSGFKQHLHVCALSGLRSWTEPSNQPLWIIRLLYEALLSDSPDIIQLVAHFDHADLHNPHMSSHLMDSVLLQASILGRDEIIAEALSRLPYKGSSADRKALEKGHHFFDCLVKKDGAGLIRSIMDATRTPAAEHDPYFGHFMHLSASAKVKLCHLRGIPIEIDHPLVPMDLVRVAPLAHYDNVYDFLEPGFAPLKPTLKDRWRFYIRRRARNRTAR